MRDLLLLLEPGMEERERAPGLSWLFNTSQMHKEKRCKETKSGGCLSGAQRVAENATGASTKSAKSSVLVQAFFACLSRMPP